LAAHDAPMAASGGAATHVPSTGGSTEVSAPPQLCGEPRRERRPRPQAAAQPAAAAGSATE